MGARRRPFISGACCQAPPATNPGGSSGNETGGFKAAAPPLFGLAPGGVCRAVPVTRTAVRSYRTLSPLPSEALAKEGGLLSVALSLGSPPPEVIRHRASKEPGLSSLPADTLATGRAAIQPADRGNKGLPRTGVKPVSRAQSLAYRPRPFDQLVRSNSLSSNL